MKKLDKPVLAEGESTGHQHLLDAGVDVYENETGEREFTPDKPVNLVHQQHDVVILPAKELISDRKTEYDPFREEARKVQD